MARAKPQRRLVNIAEENISFDVYIGRGVISKWGNPFVIHRDGTRKEVIEKYEKYIRGNQELLNALPELVDKVLGCFCYPQPCHGEVLLRLLVEHGLEPKT